MKEIAIYNTQQDTQHMTSLEIAELTSKQHKDVLKAIRNMEPAWENVTGRKFALCERHDGMMAVNGEKKRKNTARLKIIA